MRLIDADELKIYISTTFCDTCKRDKGVCSSCAFDDVFIAIDNAPTIDAEPKAGEWIPCSKRLPDEEDMYQPPEQRYLCQLEAYGERKFCVLSRLKGAVSPFWDWYGVAVHDSEVTAWMPLPKPYREESEVEP